MAYKQKNQMKKNERYYKGYYIERTPTGYFRAYLNYDGRFVMADTFSGIKNMINSDIQKLKK